MSGFVNIGNNNRDDPFYRYKMPKLEIKEMINKTVIQNIVLLAKSLDRDKEEILSFWSIKLGTTFIKKENALRGKFEINELNRLLNIFVEEYISCKCGNPETEYFLGKKNIYRICKACSAKTKIVDTVLSKKLLKIYPSAKKLEV